MFLPLLLCWMREHSWQANCCRSLVPVEESCSWWVRSLLLLAIDGHSAFSGQIRYCAIKRPQINTYSYTDSLPGRGTIPCDGESTVLWVIKISTHLRTQCRFCCHKHVFLLEEVGLERCSRIEGSRVAHCDSISERVTDLGCLARRGESNLFCLFERNKMMSSEWYQYKDWEQSNMCNDSPSWHGHRRWVE